MRLCSARVCSGVMSRGIPLNTFILIGCQMCPVTGSTRAGTTVMYSDLSDDCGLNNSKPLGSQE